MRLSQSLCDQCYGFALKAKKLRECEDEFHRNTKTQRQVAYKHKEANISRLKVFRKEVWSAIATDKKLVEQIWYWLTGQGPTSLIGVVSMPIENWHELADNNTERHGVVSAWREVLWNAESFDNNFEFGPYCFVKPEGAEHADAEVSSIMHRSSGQIASLGRGFRILVSDIGPCPSQFKLEKWSSVEHCCIKGPGNFTLSVRKLFPDEVQKQYLVCPDPVCMIANARDRSAAIRPPHNRPDTHLRFCMKFMKLLQGLAVAGGTGATDAQTLQRHNDQTDFALLPDDIPSDVEEQPAPMRSPAPIMQMPSPATMTRQRTLQNAVLDQELPGFRAHHAKMEVVGAEIIADLNARLPSTSEPSKIALPSARIPTEKIATTGEVAASADDEGVAATHDDEGVAATHDEEVQKTDEVAAKADDAPIPHSEKCLTMEKQKLADEAVDVMYKTPEKLVVRRRVTPTVVDGEDTGDKIADKMSMLDDVADDFKDAVDPLKDQDIIFA